MTDEQIIKELRNLADIMKCLGDMRKTKILTEAVALIERLIVERDQARRDCAVAEQNHAALAERVKSETAHLFSGVDVRNIVDKILKEGI